MAATQESLHFLDYWRVIRARKEIVIAVFLLVVLTGILFTFNMPKVYAASCKIQVKEDAPDLNVFERERWSYDPLFLRTQFEIIQSIPKLEEVVHRQGLTRKLKPILGPHLPEDALLTRTIKYVRDALRVQHYRDTNLIEIRVQYSSPEGEARMAAAETANLLAEVYREQEMARNLRVTRAALAALKNSLDEQREAVKQASEKVEEIRTKYNILVYNEETGSDSVMELRILTRLEDERIRVRLELEGKKARYQKALGLTSADLEDAAPYLVGDPALQSLVMARREATVRRKEFERQNLGPQHPEMKRVNATIAELQDEIDDALNGLRLGIRTEYEAALAQLKAVDKMLEEQRQEEITAESSQYREFDRALEDLEHARRIRDALEVRYLQEQIQLDIPKTNVELIERAKVPEESDYVSPNVVLNIILTVFMAVCAGIGLAYFVEYVDTSVKTLEDVEAFMELPVIGVIPQRVDTFTDPKSYREHAEAYRMMRTNVRFSERAKGGQTFCVTSGSMGEGKSLTVFNLAYTCAALGDSVVVVDADLHRPRQHKMMGGTNELGLANILVGEVSLDDALVETEHNGVHFLPSGKLSTGVHGLLDNTLMNDLIKTLTERYDLVLFDAPPIIGVSDASLLVREMDGVLLVIQHRKYPRSVSMRAKAMVENAGGNIVGVVLNRINVAKDYSYYHYGSYYYSRRYTTGDREAKGGQTA